jgi:glycosyltransferase involved in cell wall biosynthesis
MSPRVTVVMPVFNGERFIGDAIASARASRFTDFELLVLDDGSTDGSVAAAHRASEGDPRVRIVNLPHGGVGATRQIGLTEARGEFIANLDADDLMLPIRLTRQVRHLDRYPDCVAVGARALVIDADGRPKQIMGQFFSHDAIDRALLGGHGSALSNQGAMFRRAVALQVGGYGAHLHTTGEDHDLWLRMAEAGRLACLPEVLNLYRVHSANVSLGEGSKERRLPITLDTLARAFARRGIVGREPAKIPNPPLQRWERLCNDALLYHWHGRRAQASRHAILAAMLQPTAAPAWSAVRSVLSRPSMQLKGVVRH